MQIGLLMGAFWTMIKRFLLLFALSLLVLAACGAKDEPTAVAGTPATLPPTPTINPVFLRGEPTAIPPTAIPTLAPTATPEPTATPDPLALSADYNNPTLGIAFTHPLDWLVEAPSETQIVAGLSAAVASSQAVTQTKPAQLLLSISAEQSNGSNPLTLLSESEPSGQTNFIVFPESVPLASGKAAHSISTVTHPASGTTYQSERFAVVVGDDAYIIEFSQSGDAAEANAPLIKRIMNSLTLTGVDRATIAGSILQQQEDIDGGEIFIDQIVTGTISSGVNYLIGLGSRSPYLITTISEKADLVLTIAS
ncbi:MAG TPA: hypothetical protein ENJ56_01615, partial [Anaerolineae bacterium]|nr:hypothetical protein [Anaerolineae bacterium]